MQLTLIEDLKMPNKAGGRRKKTNAELKALRLKKLREKQIEAKGIQWRDLARVHVTKQQYIDSLHESMDRMVDNTFVKNAIPSIEYDKLVAERNDIVKAIKVQNAILNDIGKKHQHAVGTAISISDKLIAIGIGEEYEGWQATVMSTIMPRVQELLGTLEELVTNKHPTIHEAATAYREYQSKQTPSEEIASEQ
jgi:hypothetical protein